MKYVGRLLVQLILSVLGGYAAGNRGADYVKYLAPALAPEPIRIESIRVAVEVNTLFNKPDLII